MITFKNRSTPAFYEGHNFIALVDATGRAYVLPADLIKPFDTYLAFGQGIPEGVIKLELFSQTPLDVSDVLSEMTEEYNALDVHFVSAFGKHKSALTLNTFLGNAPVAEQQAPQPKLLFMADYFEHQDNKQFREITKRVVNASDDELISAFARVAKNGHERTKIQASEALNGLEFELSSDQALQRLDRIKGILGHAPTLRVGSAAASSNATILKFPLR